MRFLYILIIFIIIAIAINKFFFSINKNDTEKNIKVKQEEIYNQKGNPYFADVWVALSVNIWKAVGGDYTSFKQDEVYDNVMDIEFMMNHKEISKNQIIKTNVELLNDYISLLETDVMELLSKSINRMEVFDAFVMNLNYRWIFIKKHLIVLEKQKIELQKTEKTMATKLIRYKNNIRNSLKELNRFWTTDNLEKYLILREQYTYVKVYLYFITKFIDNYNNLQDYNRKYIMELREVRDLIISGEKIHIPKWNLKILKKYDLLTEDEDYLNLSNIKISK